MLSDHDKHWYPIKHRDDRDDDNDDDDDDDDDDDVHS